MGEAHNSFHELHSGFPAAAVYRDGEVAAAGGETAQALADVRLRVTSHYREFQRGEFKEVREREERERENWRERQRAVAIYPFYHQEPLCRLQIPLT